MGQDGMVWNRRGGRDGTGQDKTGQEFASPLSLSY